MSEEEGRGSQLVVEAAWTQIPKRQESQALKYVKFFFDHKNLIFIHVIIQVVVFDRSFWNLQ